MTNNMTAGARLRRAVAAERPLQVVGAINAYHAMMAERVGYRAIYLSGGGVAAASYGLPDLGMTSLDNVLEDVHRITYVTELPLLVDIDTGWGSAFNIARTVKQMVCAGAAGAHIEDQVLAKRCGHRPGKAIVSKEEMVDRVKAAVDARTDDFVIMARTDALAVEGMDSAIERAMRLRRGRRRHDLPRSHARPRPVPPVRRGGRGAGARQHHRVRGDAPVHRGAAARGRAWAWCCTRCPPSAP